MRITLEVFGHAWTFALLRECMGGPQHGETLVLDSMTELAPEEVFYEEDKRMGFGS